MSFLTIWVESWHLRGLSGPKNPWLCRYYRKIKRKPVFRTNFDRSIFRSIYEMPSDFLVGWVYPKNSFAMTSTRSWWVRPAGRDDESQKAIREPRQLPGSRNSARNSQVPANFPGSWPTSREVGRRPREVGEITCFCHDLGTLETVM